jgi:hypothetical protein
MPENKNPRSCLNEGIGPGAKTSECPLADTRLFIAEQKNSMFQKAKTPF